MNDPLSHVLPEAVRFSVLEGSQLVLLLGVILFFGAIGGRLFQKLKIPQVVGYIVIGIIIGSSGLQLLGKETIAALNPVSTIALSFIGFLVGAELKIGVTTAVTPILSLGFCEAKTDAHYDYGPQKTCSINRKLLF